MRYIIPAFFVCHSASKDAADWEAGEICHKLNAALRDIKCVAHTLLLDEERDTFEVPVGLGHELPHTCGNEAKALAACLQLCRAYDAGKESNSVDWSDVDEAHSMALDALGISRQIQIGEVRTTGTSSGQGISLQP